MTDEDIIKRRLMYDGDGTGDDRRLNLMQKLICKWAKGDSSSIENKLLYDRILNILSQCECNPRRSRLSMQKTKKEIDNFIKVRDVMNNQIKSVKESINYVKDILRQSKLARQNKMMYDLLINDIMVHPARQKSTQVIEKYKMEIEGLSKDQLTIKENFENLKKHVHLFINSSNQILQDIEGIEKLPDVKLTENAGDSKLL